MMQELTNVLAALGGLGVLVSAVKVAPTIRLILRIVIDTRRRVRAQENHGQAPAPDELDHRAERLLADGKSVDG